MGTIAIIGDRTTTTTLAIAAAWNGEPSPLVVEVDPAGGSLAAWLDMPANPSLSTIVAQGGTPTWSGLEPMVRTSRQGLRIIPAPVRSREAGRAIDESCNALLPMLATENAGTTLLDLGRVFPADGVPRTARGAEAVVVCHRQEPASARAAAVRLERLAETVELLGPLDVSLTIALIGDQPYDGDEVLDYLVDADAAMSSTALNLVVVPVDPLCAAVLAGRVGVSARRLARLPLMRAARSMAEHIASPTRASMAPDLASPDLTSRGTASRSGGS